MRFKLWQKMAITFMAIAIIVTLLVFLVVNLAFERRFQTYIDNRQEIINQQLVKTIASAYAKNNSWNEESMLIIPHWAIMNGLRLRIVDVDGKTIIQTPDNIKNNRILRTGRTARHPIIVSKTKIGDAYITIASDLFEIPEEDVSFRVAINQVIFFGGLTAIIISFFLGYLVSARLTLPLETMTKAAKKMEEGELAYRIDIRSKDEIGDLAYAFNHLAAALERQESLRRNLTADIAHELRTPLTTIRSHIEAYIDGVMVPDKDNIESIHEEIIRLTRLVDDLGQIASMESGKVNIDKLDIELNELVSKLINNIQPLFTNKGVALELLNASEKLIVKIDADKISQVFYNLLNNALKFTPAGGLCKVSIERQNDVARIVVSDTGIGIDSENVPLIFERFYRVDKSRSRDSGGAGIGLTLVKEFMEAHDGKVSVTSLPGKGSEFELILPLV